jgi:predicted DsbA family dithiol-disulfide isomerase
MVAMLATVPQRRLDCARVTLTLVPSATPGRSMQDSHPSPSLRIDFVSDVSCPWCAIGLNSLEQAIARLGGSIHVDLHFQPFELNPHMAPEGEDVNEHLRRKYGSTPEQLGASREAIRRRGAELGFKFNARERIHNTFDAHRLLHWAALEGRARELKHALLRAYFTDGVDVSAHAHLERIAADAGLDPLRARCILESDEYAEDVRRQEQHYLDNGIHSVPAVIINQRHLISGGQPVEVFEQALRQIAALP